MLAVACKKEGGATAAFMPEGYWRGYAYLFNSSLLNRENGGGIFYLGMQNSDTNTALIKMEGRFTISNGIYSGKFGKGSDSLFLTSITASDRVMYGITTIVSATTTLSTEFQMIKQ